MTPKEFTVWLKPYAQDMEAKHGIPYVFIIAQLGLESGWGMSAIGNNLGGIKAGKSWTGKKQLVTTTEWFNHQLSEAERKRFPEIISHSLMSNGKWKYVVKDWFRDYDSIGDFMEDHSKVLLQPQFSAAIGETDPVKFATKLQSGRYKYATAPDYVQIMTSVIKTVLKYV